MVESRFAFTLVLHYFIIQSEVKPNHFALALVSRASGRLYVVTSSYDWFTVLSITFVIGQSDYFGFRVRTRNRQFPN